ncbi:MAG TPA: tandem-95 repeat protein, partial [Alphaproteobacteria bacterium]|nr:tandem-95 repeat protein [Alphaproteobacteria bacterium]
GDTVTVKSVGSASNGTASLLNGEVMYTPDYNFSGTDSFTYTVTDGKGGTDTKTVNVIIAEVNEAVGAIDDTHSMEQDSLASVIDLKGNDTDSDGDTLEVISVDTTNTANGTVTIDLGVVSYKPDADFYGTDSFDYTVTDGNGSTDTATAIITVTALNSAPVTVNDTGSLDEDTSIQIDVLANDSDVDAGDSLIVASVSDAANGSVKLMMGYVFYTPDTDFYGADTFTYVAQDNQGAISTGTVTLTVNATNDAAKAITDVVTVQQDTAAVTIDVLGNDTDAEDDALTLISVGSADNGVVAMVSGKVTYIPTASYTGTDTFTYVVGDLDPDDGVTVQSKTVGTVSITVSETNIDPITVDDVETVTEATATSGTNKFSVLTNDEDPNGDNLTLDSVSTALYGTASVAGANVLYSPNVDFEGLETLTYTVSDGNGGTKTGTITITIRGVNDDPIAIDDSLGSVSVEKGPAKLDVLANDYDIDLNDSIDIKYVRTDSESDFATSTTSLRGNIITVANNKITYTESGAASGQDSFDYQIIDSDGATSTATATFIISSNTNPNALNDELEVAEDAVAYQLNVEENDTEIDDGDSVSVSSIGVDASHGLVEIINGSIFYTPNLNYVGADTFSYFAKDTRGGLDEATVSLTITAVNDTPTATSDNVVIEVDSSATIVDVLGNDSDIDGDTLTVSSVDTESLKGGTVALTAGVVTFTPKAGFIGTDSFNYELFDGTATKTGSVSVAVNAANSAPVGVEDSVSIIEDSRSNEILVLTNDTDVDDDTLSVVAVTEAQYGKVKILDGVIDYAPNANFNGTDIFTYTVSDGNGATTTSIVTVTVTDDGDDVASAVNDDLGDAAVSSNQAIKLDLTSNDISGDNGSITIESVAAAKYGTTSLSGGDVYYTPGSQTGIDTFTYTLVGNGSASTATAKINLVAINSDSTGAVTIKGDVQVGQTLTVTNTLADDDGMDNSIITYQWYKDGSTVDGATASTYDVTLEEVGSEFVVEASYTDDLGSTETASSEATDAVTQLDTPFSFVATPITGLQAADIASLSGYSFDDDDALIKLTLNVNLDSIVSRTDITSIAGADLSLNIDWTQFDAIDSNVTKKFIINQVDSGVLIMNSSSTSDSDTFDTIALASIRTTGPLLSIVDSDASNDFDSGITNSADLIEVYVRPSVGADKLSIELSGTVSANQGQFDFNQYDSTMSNINNVAGNSVATGDVTISGVVEVDQILTASHNLADLDGIGVVTYQWLRDSVEISNATDSTYTLTTSDINKAISVSASYTDGASNDETVVSTSQELTQSTDDKPLMFSSTLITAAEASIERYGSDYSLNPDEVIIRLTLEADMARFTDASITSIAGLELDFNLDWTNFENLTYIGGTEKLFNTYDNYTGTIFKGIVTDSTTG